MRTGFRFRSPNGMCICSRKIEGFARGLTSSGMLLPLTMLIKLRIYLMKAQSRNCAHEICSEEVIGHETGTQSTR